MADKPDSELIRGASPTAYALWNLPSFDAEPLQVPLETAEPDAADETVIELPEEVEEAPKPFTVEELEQIREEAYNEGFAAGERDGFHSGQIKGQQEAKTRLDVRLGEIEALMSQLMEPMHEQDEQIEDMLLKLVETMVRQVIQRELLTDSSQIVRVLRGALKALPMGAGNIRIYLNPADFEAVKALRERHEESWRLLEDDALLPGGCRVETEHSQVDATLETRLAQIIEQLFEERREQRAHPPEPDMTLVATPGPNNP
ncbi:flagellar assembly protein FliH [Halopseudomonas xinjiangensis]|uniref:Flagellar assembly protein FliH n=1 Tax=Halopseudomonas xinjiangensis TaxID=487184 RepID=A0A1H1MSR4_9GAMM|nr:flagellar assembly protein FliH [Halopseudomonas xinjiangensis]SDR88939.1 flagellar assembly protein FliH [Halopseudomonas xinjiangensis]